MNYCRDNEYVINIKINFKLLELFSNYGMGGRYYYLDIFLEGKSETLYPEKKWQEFQLIIIRENNKILNKYKQGKFDRAAIKVNKVISEKIIDITKWIMKTSKFCQMGYNPILIEEAKRILKIKIYNYEANC